MSTNQTATITRRRDRQREETRRDLALAAFELTAAQGLDNVRVPDIAAAAGVSTRTFNNYFPSKEAAIVWPATRRGAQMAENLLARPADEPLADAIVAAVIEVYDATRQEGLPAGWLQKFRAVIAGEPGLRGEFLKAAEANEQALATAIAERTGAGANELQPKVVAAIVAGAERAAIRHWMQQESKTEPLVDTVRAALNEALPEVPR